MSSDPLSAVDIAEGHRLDKAATPGSWWHSTAGYVFGGLGTSDSPMVAAELSPSDARLIAWARNHLPALLDAAEKVADLPRRIESIAELEALPDNSIIRWEASNGLSRGMIERFDGGWWQPGNHIRLTTNRIPLPAILIWTPKDAS